MYQNKIFLRHQTPTNILCTSYSFSIHFFPFLNDNNEYNNSFSCSQGTMLRVQRQDRMTCKMDKKLRLNRKQRPILHPY